jgi:F-type H+-transporting ATPase subunit b
VQELLGNLGIDWRLFIAQTINFLLVLWLLNRFVFKRIIKHLEERRSKIEQGLELTEKAKREIGRIDEARSRELEKARTEAEKILSNARSGASEKEKAALVVARAEAEKIMLKAREEAQKEKKEAVLGAKSEIQKLSSLIAEKILGRSVKEEDQEESAKEVMDYFEKYAK